MMRRKHSSVLIRITPAVECYMPLRRGEGQALMGSHHALTDSLRCQSTQLQRILYVWMSHPISEMFHIVDCPFQGLEIPSALWIARLDSLYSEQSETK